jgi:CBS domain-containing protein
LKIGSALPRLLDRKYPTVKPSYPLLTVLYLLRIQDVPAVPINEDGFSRRAVFGFSILPQLVELTPKNFDKYLEGPCESASVELGCFGMNEDLETLLEGFKKTKMGVCLVSGKVKGETRISLVSLVDLLRLYKTKQLQSDMVVADVASPILGMPGRSSIREALGAMFRLKQRRVFISGEQMYISDRSIIEKFLSPASLVRDRDEPNVGVLDARIDGLKKIAPIEVTAKASLHLAALHLRSEWGPCLKIVGREVVVTPWDLIMKPWEAGRLAISAKPKG